MEANNNRKNDEIERRNLQVRTQGLIQENTERKLMARMYAKSFLRTFKKVSFQVLSDIGFLRSQFNLSLGSVFIPKLLGQAEYYDDLVISNET